jgi:RHS repeat-associated protein
VLCVGDHYDHTLSSFDALGLQLRRTQAPDPGAPTALPRSRKPTSTTRSATARRRASARRHRRLPPNALKEIHSGSAGGALLASLAYDLNGNLQSDGTRTFTWDAIDQLSQVSNGTTTVAYAYDGLGRRTKKTVNGALTQWLHNGDQLYAEYGSSWTNPTARWSSAGLDQPVLRGQVNGDGSDGTAQYALADGLGSVIALANSADATVASQRFDAWGNKTASTGTIPNYGYTGREPDETGLIFYRARYYHPGIGRFASRDPSGLQGGINPYAYVGNNPVMRVDPTGMTAEPPSAGAPAENYAGGDCMAMNESRLGDDPEKISDAAGREGVDFSDGPVKMAAGMCYRWDDGKSSIKASPDPRADVFQYQLAPSMQDAGLNALGFGVVKWLGGAAKLLGLGGEVAGSGAAAATEATEIGGFFRGAKPGELPSFAPRPSEFKVDSISGAVAPTHGVSVFNNELSVTSKGFEAYQVNLHSVPDSLQIIQRGKDLSHFEITPAPGANLTVDQFVKALSCITCR